MTGLYRGGRGKRAPYSTRVVRLPDPVINCCEQLTEIWVNQGMPDQFIPFMSQQSAIEISQIILRQKNISTIFIKAVTGFIF